MLRFWKAVFAAVLLISSVVFSSTALAQVETGQIVGTVTDQSGAVVPNATVTARNLATNAERTSQTSTTGAFLVESLEPGTYEVTVKTTGFQPFVAKVEVTVGSHVTVDAKLSVNTTTTEVEVVGEGGVQVNTQTQELSQTVNTQQLANLPSLTRNPYDFVTLSGNVSNGDNTTNSMSSGQNLTTRGVGFSLNGQRESGTEILLDGVENIAVFGVSVGQNVPLDAVQEYSVITNNFAAEYGRASGGIVNLTTKSGTNAFHGSAWEFNRLSAYTANTYANDAANAAAGSIVNPKGIYTRNQFGFQVGGPILQNKLFFSASTEWTRVRSQASETQEILDPSFIALLPANTQAYFKQYGTGAYPASGAVTTAGQLAAAGLSVNPINGVTPVASSQPIFDVVNFKAPFDAGGDVPQNTYSLVYRVDFNMNEKTQMFFRGGREHLDQFAGSDTYSAYPQYDSGGATTDQSYLYSITHTFSPTLLDNLKASYTRFNTVTSFDTALVNTPNLMFTPPTDPVTNGNIQLPGLQNEGEPGLGGLPFGGPQNTVQIQDDLSWTKGRHAMRFGGQFTYIQLNVAYGAYAQAVEQLGGTPQNSMDDLVNAAGSPNGSQLVAFGARVNPQGQLPCVANPGYWNTNSVSDLITDPACAVTPPLTSASYARSYRYKDWALYGQDSFKITPKLTINYGLRYEHYGVQHNNKADLDSNFYPGTGSGIEQNVRAGQVYIADKSPVGQFWAPRWGTPAPRVGFAYDVFGNGTTSIRGGFGISYERNFGNVTYNASFNPPASAVLNAVCAPQSFGTPAPACGAFVTNNNLGPLGLPGPPSYLGPSEIRMPNPHINVAQTQFWSLAVQRQVARSTVVEVSYSGAHGVHLYDIENINLLGAGQAYLGDPLTFPQSPDCASPCYNRPNDQYSNINMRGSLGQSSYNAMNIKFQTQDPHNTGLSVVANYTLAHAMDNISSTFSDSLQGGSGDIGSLGYTDLLNPGLDLGASDYDVRNRFVLAPVWNTPWFNTTSNWEGQLAGGWSISGIYTIRSGTPFSVYDYSNELNFYTVPRLTPVTPINQWHVVKSPSASGPNNFNGLVVPIPANYNAAIGNFEPLNPTLGISDFGPFPGNMTSRNAFRGDGAWNFDAAIGKTFKVGERVQMQFRAETFDAFNHHNFYTNTTNLLYDGPAFDANNNPIPPSPLTVNLLKGGLGTLATGGNHDERRFWQFSLRASF
jgi:Carboxypeptidase regulatory-like domain/TonB dependent receptor